MAKITNIIRKFRDDIATGRAWIVVYKQGRSWNARSFIGTYDKDHDCFEFAKSSLEEMVRIARLDGNAICINGLHNSSPGDLTLKEIENKILGFYEDQQHQLVWDFLKGDILPGMNSEAS